MFCCRAGDETGGLDLEKQKEGKMYGQPTYYPGRSGLWVSRECLLVLGAVVKQRGGREVRRCGGGGGRKVSSVAGPGMRPGIAFGGEEEGLVTVLSTPDSLVGSAGMFPGNVSCCCWRLG